MKKILFWLNRQSPARLLSMGFAAVILIGALVLMLPFSHKAGTPVRFIDALFVSTSAVCVTGLTTVPVGDTFTPIGYTVIAILIQIGGLGVATVGVLFTLLIGRKIGLKTRQLVVEAMNFSGYGGLIQTVKFFLKLTFIVEAVGAVLSTLVFLPDYNVPTAIGYGMFHSVSAFNNAGFDILGGFDSLLNYADNVPMNLITTALVIIGGFGFLAIFDLIQNRFVWKPLRLNTKVVTVMTVTLLVGGTILLKLTSGQTWLEAWFQSVIARTAGFNTYPLANFSQAAILIFCILMFIGASPGSTGGGIKTTTFFMVAFKAISSTVQNNRDEIFHRKIPRLIFQKALTVMFFGLAVVFVGTFLLLVFEPDVRLYEALVEVTSAFATVGSTVGITPHLCTASKITLILCMFIGRLGPVTIATLWVLKGFNEASYTEEGVMIG
ncbi:TrkH family potassium uptake protein [Dubosiella muris]|uniref:H(+)-transporting ATPase n=3 Tax=Dubosiella TaxID=1937008 RepID=A0AC61R9I4_9FIRM|nr:potassium transporter TrkG [Dubosiella muris]TGY66394.1 H(+)-transporting ATPase [Dubosiella muris]